MKAIIICGPTGAGKSSMALDLAKKFKGAKGRIEYLNLLLSDEKWTSNSPKISEQNLTIYIDDDYKNLLEYDTKELYWKY